MPITNLPLVDTKLMRHCRVVKLSILHNAKLKRCIIADLFCFNIVLSVDVAILKIDNDH